MRTRPPLPRPPHRPRDSPPFLSRRRSGRRLLQGDRHELPQNRLRESGCAAPGRNGGACPRFWRGRRRQPHRRRRPGGRRIRRRRPLTAHAVVPASHAVVPPVGSRLPSIDADQPLALDEPSDDPPVHAHSTSLDRREPSRHPAFHAGDLRRDPTRRWGGWDWTRYRAFTRCWRRPAVVGRPRELSGDDAPGPHQGGPPADQGEL